MLKSNNQEMQKPSIRIRREQETDHKAVEELTRKAFWNLYIPGCNEHYLVHIMRAHEDFVAELDFVLERDGQVIGNVMYTKAKLVDESGQEKQILTFGPLSVTPEYQRMGYGKLLLEHSFAEAVALGYDAIVIFGNPGNYVSRGFVCCQKHKVSLPSGVFPTAMLVKELVPGALGAKKWSYYDSPVMQLDEQAAQRFDEGLEKLEKKQQPSQEEFYILSHSVITEDSFEQG